MVITIYIIYTITFLSTTEDVIIIKQFKSNKLEVLNTALSNIKAMLDVEQVLTNPVTVKKCKFDHEFVPHSLLGYLIKLINIQN